MKQMQMLRYWTHRCFLSSVKWRNVPPNADNGDVLWHLLLATLNGIPHAASYSVLAGLCGRGDLEQIQSALKTDASAFQTRFFQGEFLSACLQFLSEKLYFLMSQKEIPILKYIPSQTVYSNVSRAFS